MTTTYLHVTSVCLTYIFIPAGLRTKTLNHSFLSNVVCGVSCIFPYVMLHCYACYLFPHYPNMLGNLPCLLIHGQRP